MGGRGENALSLFNESSIKINNEGGSSDKESTEYIEMQDKGTQTDSSALWSDFYNNFDKFKDEMAQPKQSKFRDFNGNSHSQYTDNSNFLRNNNLTDDEKIYNHRLRFESKKFCGSSSFEKEEEEVSRSEITGNKYKMSKNEPFFDANQVNKRKMKRGKSKTIQNSPLNENRELLDFSDSKQISPKPSKDKEEDLRPLDHLKKMSLDAPFKSIKFNQKMNSNQNFGFSDEDGENLIPIIDKAMKIQKRKITKETKGSKRSTSRRNVGTTVSQMANKKLRKLDSKIIEDDKEDDFSDSSIHIQGLSIKNTSKKKVIQMKSCNDVQKHGITIRDSDSDSSDSNIDILEDEENLMNKTMVQY